MRFTYDIKFGILQVREIEISLRKRSGVTAQRHTLEGALAVGVSREGGGFQTLMIIYPATSTHNHSVSDCSVDWSTSGHTNCLWTNVTRPCFLQRTDPASEKLRIASLFAVVQWVSCRTRTSASFLQASCSMTLILHAMSPSVFICGILGLRSSSLAGMLPRLENGVLLSIPRRTHTARVAVVALVTTGLVSTSGNAAAGRAAWRHLSSSSF